MKRKKDGMNEMVNRTNRKRYMKTKLKCRTKRKYTGSEEKDHKKRTRKRPLARTRVRKERAICKSIRWRRVRRAR